ncbi:MAG: T9SS type A sorting domain-containing protein [Ignavibacteriaceae bacterium]|nr:T9SS type A sorting domain-containing protein [Ignavibacteriaceae bacterium]
MKTLITIFLLTISFSLVNAQELVRNGGFENTNHFEFWDAYVTVTGASVEPVNTAAHSGMWSIEIKSGTTPVGGWTKLMQTLLNPSNNADYKLTFWMKDSVTANNFLGVYGLTGSGGEVALGIDSLNNTSIADPDSGRIVITQSYFQNWGRINYFFNSGQGYIGYLLKFEEATSGNSLTLHLDDFSILPVPGQAIVQVTAPNGGENWFVNSQQNITWTSTNITNVKIDYSTNNGGLWLDVVASVPAASGSYTWTIPNTPSTQCLIRVSDATIASRFDISDSVFTITPLITVTSPNGGENWVGDTQHDITWTSLNLTDVSIDYSTDNGSNWINVVSSAPAAGGSYTWMVANTPSTQCLVRISDASNPSIYDISDATFTITAAPNPMITVTAPNGGEVWVVGTVHQIKWTRQDVTTVKIDYSTDNGSTWSVVVASRPAVYGNYNWTIPNTPSTQCLVRISDISNPAVFDVSDGTFTIQDVVPVEDLNSGIPEEYNLAQSYPNPFNPSTIIEFSLPESASNVNLSIYNVLGEKVAELINNALTAGKYQYQWNAENFTSGIYIYELRTDKFVAFKKMILLK